MKIEVFGSGCRKCHETEQAVRTTLTELGLEAEVVKVTDIGEIVSRGIMTTPAVVIDGKKVCEGRVPTADMVKSWLK